MAANTTTVLQDLVESLLEQAPNKAQVKLAELGSLIRTGAPWPEVPTILRRTFPLRATQIKPADLRPGDAFIFHNIKERAQHAAYFVKLDDDSDQVAVIALTGPSRGHAIPFTFEVWQEEDDPAIFQVLVIGEKRGIAETLAFLGEP